MSYRHIVLIQFRDSAPPGVIADVERHLECLGRRSELLGWTVARSIDERKGVVLVENALFADGVAFQAWRTSAEHEQMTELLSQHADWLVGDYLEEG